MHICMVSSASFPPQEGVGFYVWNLSRYLTRLGHKVSLITRGHMGQTSREVVDNIIIWRPTFWPIYPFHVHLHSLFVNDLVKKLAPDIDLLHLHTPLVKWFNTTLPVLVTVHSPMKGGTGAVSANNLLGWLIKLQSPVSYSLEQQLFQCAQKLIAVASSGANELQLYGINPQQVGVLGNGVDTDVFYPSTSEPDRLNPYFLTVGRLGPPKGLEDLVQCAEHVVRQFPNFRFLIAGAGPWEGRLRADIARRKLAGHVVLLGHISDRAKLAALYRGATAYVHPAHYEGLPTVLLEAMACGRPVVTTAVSGALDVVQHGRNGLLAPPRAPEQMAAAIIQLLQEPGLGKQLGLAACKTIEERYSWDVVGHSYLAQYETLLQGVRRETRA
jgi:glycosyltransferase involved in cell wall biosynthesis